MNGSPPWRADVAEHPGHGVLTGTPGQQRERGRVGESAHIALLVAAVALNGGAIEAHAQLQRILQVIHRNGKPLQVPQNVGKPQANELNIEVAGAAEHVFTLGSVVVS